MKALQQRIHLFSKERGWLVGVRPASYAKSIIIEAAELLEEFQWQHPTAKQVRENKKMLKAVERELADVLIYCINLANLLELEVDDIVEDKIRHNAIKYPAATLREDPTMYYKIKKAYRRWEL